MRDRVNALKGENESLKRDLVEARNKKPEVIVKKEAGFVPRLVVVFNIGKSNIILLIIVNRIAKKAADVSFV